MMKDEINSDKAAGEESLAYTLRQAAKLINVSYITAYRLNKRGLLRSSSALRTKLISRAEIERFLKVTMESDFSRN